MARGAPDYSTLITQRIESTFTLGSVEDFDLARLRQISAYVSVGNYTTLQTTRGPDGANSLDYYQVPAGKIFVAAAAIYTLSLTTNHWVLGYGDDAVVNSAAAPAGAVGLNPPDLYRTAVANAIATSFPLFKMPAGKFPYVFISGGVGAILVLGIETDA